MKPYGCGKTHIQARFWLSRGPTDLSDIFLLRLFDQTIESLGFSDNFCRWRKDESDFRMEYRAELIPRLFDKAALS